MSYILAAAAETNDFVTKFLDDKLTTINLDSDGNYTVTYTYYVNRNVFGTQAPTYKSVITPTPPTGIPATLVCLGVSGTPFTGFPDTMVMTVTYSVAQYSGGGETTPGNTFRSSQTAGQIVPIEQSTDLTDAQKLEKKGQGINAYFQGSVIYGYREIFDSFTFSETNIVGNVGTRQSPTGMTGATTDKWLLIGRDIRETDEYIEVDEKYQYDKNGWDTDLH